MTATDRCGNTLGSMVETAFLSLQPTALSEVIRYLYPFETYITQQVNLTQLGLCTESIPPPITETVTILAPLASPLTRLQTITTERVLLQPDTCKPVLLVPNAAASIQPEWGNCVLGGAFDPPVVLTGQPGLQPPPPTPAPAPVPPTPTPTPQNSPLPVNSPPTADPPASAPQTPGDDPSSMQPKPQPEHTTKTDPVPDPKSQDPPQETTAQPHPQPTQADPDLSSPENDPSEQGDPQPVPSRPFILHPTHKTPASPVVIVSQTAHPLPSNQGIVIGTQTVKVGDGAVTVGGHEVSAAASGVLVVDSSSRITIQRNQHPGAVTAVPVSTNTLPIVVGTVPDAAAAPTLNEFANGNGVYASTSSNMWMDIGSIILRGMGVTVPAGPVASETAEVTASVANSTGGITPFTGGASLDWALKAELFGVLGFVWTVFVMFW